MDQITHELFLLMINLAQLRNADRIRTIFIDAMNAMQHQVKVQLATSQDDGDHVVPVKTTNNHFGWIALSGDLTTDSDYLPALVRNAIRMLAIVLENNQNARLLAEQNQHLEAAVQERTARLQASEERYRSLVEHLPIPILVSVDGHCIYLNPAAVKLIKADTADAFWGQPINTLIPPHNRATFQAKLVESARQSPPHKTIETGMIRLDGTPILVEATALQVNYDNRDALLMICIDITERKRAEAELSLYRAHLEDVVNERTAELRAEISNRRRIAEKLVERTDELQAANDELIKLGRIKDDFVTNISHELRTPIMNLKLREHIIARNPEQVAKHLPVIRRETDRLSHIIEDLLNLARLDQGRIQAEKNNIDLNTLASEYVEDRRTVAHKKELSLNVIESADQPTVLGDKGMLGQALSILLTNAFNYTPPGGVITVAVRNHAESGDPHWAALEVQDTGHGIPPNELPQLFDRFFRGEIARETRTAGTGLGLSILKEIVEYHQGRIEVASEGVPGRGSTFRIWLPQRSEPH